MTGWPGKVVQKQLRELNVKVDKQIWSAAGCRHFSLPLVTSRMGYDVHITRAENWCESDAAPITLDEWSAYVADDPEMRMDGFAEAEASGGNILRVEGEGLAAWLTYSGHGKDGNMAWFDYRRGRIVVKEP